MLHRILTDRCVDVALAVDGKDAWEQLREQNPDLLITDIEMPRWSGVDLLNAVRTARNPRIAKMPMIVVSSVAPLEIENVRAMYPRTYFLPKPVHVDELDELLQMIAASSRLRVERN